jgi:short-subunit dehydrogenase
VSGNFVNEISLEEDLNLISLNISSVVHLAKLILPEMVERRSGRVLITSSVAALMPGPFYATYAASKSFLLSFSEALFNELKDSGVTVTALLPGPTDTNFFSRAGLEDTKLGMGEKDDPALVAEQGFEAMMKGDDYIVAGSIGNKIEGFMTNFLSQQMKANLQRRSTEKKEGLHH